MAEDVLLKYCPGCGITKPRTEFHKSKGRYDGVVSWCKECKNQWFRNHIKSGKGKDNHLVAVRNWKKTENGKSMNRLYYAKAVKDNPARKARRTVCQAVETGTLPKAQTLTCINCGKTAREYHHHKGYEKQNWLEVVPVCRPCHRAEDDKRRANN